MYFMISSILAGIVKLFRLLTVEGKEHLPKEARYVITCTHTGWVDVIMLALAVYPTPVHFMAKKELFDRVLFRKFLTAIHAFPVNRENPGPSTLKIPLKLLKENKCVGIFPSGTRSAENVPLKKGAATIAVKAQVPLIPAAYQGPNHLAGIFRGEKALIRFGQAILPETPQFKRGEAIEDALLKLERGIQRLE
ncbi:lysophospholipid acyltransferase family protein [Planococcus sp. YIM B11945]|uniref:lysophospholipid acyltransferase family protein n=1 Tax=Planococcus sp. YIM B11945 TaxID=3435410 RepID=UPI003D7CE5EE